jgi:hypothetical protein
MFKWIYLLLLVSSVTFVFWKGKFDERLTAAALLTGSVMTPILFSMSTQSWLSPDITLLLNEAAVTAVVLFVAYRSKRFWPLPVAAFQIAALMTPLAALFGENLASRALGVTQGMWAYLQLTILVAATYREQLRTKMTNSK